MVANFAKISYVFSILFGTCAFLLSEEGQQSLVDLHVDGIISYLGSL